MNIKEIIQAWIIAGNPTDVQRELAEERGKICDDCPYKKTFIDSIRIATVCTACGCPITKKVFSNQFNACTLRKWEKIDENYFPAQKNEKTLF